MPMRQYNAAGNTTNTASATIPIAAITGAAAVTTEITEFVIGSDAVASNAAKYAWQRHTTIPVGGTAITPQNVGVGTTASVSTFMGTGITTGPTLTANAFVYQVGLNQQATYRFLQNPGFGLMVPQTAAAGLSLMSLVSAVAFNVAYTVTFNE